MRPPRCTSAGGRWPPGPGRGPPEASAPAAATARSGPAYREGPNRAMVARTSESCSSPVAGQPPEVKDDVQTEANHHQGDQEPVVLLDEEDERCLVHRRFVVRQPSRGEVCGSVLMAPATGLYQVRLEYGRTGVVRRLDVMHTVAVAAHGDIGPHLRRLILVEPHGLAVEIVQVGLEDVRGDIVLVHELLFGVALGAEKDGAAAGRGGGGAGDGVDAVAIDAGGDVRVVLGEGGAVDALAVALVDLAVAGGAGARDLDAGTFQRRNNVGAVAVGADGGLGVACGHRVEVDAVEGAGVVLEVAALAGLVLGAGVVAAVAHLRRRVGVIAAPLVTVQTVQLTAVDRPFVHADVNLHRQRLSTWEGHAQTTLTVAAQARLVGLQRGVRRVGGPVIGLGLSDERTER